MPSSPEQKRDRRARDPEFRESERLGAITRWHALTPDQKKERQLLKLYGLSLASWNALFDSQGRCCAICKTETPNSKKGWATDHDHKTGKVRAILCPRCNITVGRVEILGLQKIDAYLAAHQ